MSKVVVMQHGRLEQHILNHEALASGTGNTQKLKGSEEIVCKALLFLLPGIFPQISGWLMPADVSLSYVLLCVIYFIYHNALQVYSCCHRCQGFFSNACIMHSVVYIPRFPSASLQQWALGPFLYLGCFDSCRSEHGSTNISFRYRLCYFWTLYPKVGVLVRWFYFWFVVEIPYCFPQWLNQLALPPTVHGGPLCTSSPTLVICSLFENSHPYRCEVMSPWGFDLHFPVVYCLLYLGSNGFIPELLWLKILHILLSLISWAASVLVTVSTWSCFNWFSKYIWDSCK